MQRFETFAFLPPLSNAQIEAQLAHLLAQGWVPGLEFAENPNTADFFWRQWPLQPARLDAAGRPQPLNASQILNQLETCARRHPYAVVRVTGYSPQSRQIEMSFIARTPAEGQ